MCICISKTEDRVVIARGGGGGHNCIFGIVLADSMQFRQMALATCRTAAAAPPPPRSSPAAAQSVSIVLPRLLSQESIEKAFLVQRI